MLFRSGEGGLLGHGELLDLVVQVLGVAEAVGAPGAVVGDLLGGVDAEELHRPGPHEGVVLAAGGVGGRTEPMLFQRLYI